MTQRFGGIYSVLNQRDWARFYELWTEVFGSEEDYPYDPSTMSLEDLDTHIDEMIEEYWCRLDADQFKGLNPKTITPSRAFDLSDSRRKMGELQRIQLKIRRGIRRNTKYIDSQSERQ